MDRSLNLDPLCSSHCWLGQGHPEEVIMLASAERASDLIDGETLGVITKWTCSTEKLRGLQIPTFD